MDGQGEAKLRGGLHARMPGLVAALGVLALALPAPAAERQTPSGLPVPRYVTLKFDTVNARGGPGDDHRLLWVYHARGLPVQVVAETLEWRRICDPDRGLAWVHRRTTDGRQAVMNLQAGPITLRRSPKPAGQPAAYLNRRALAALDKCSKGWCRVKVAGIKAWAPASQLWGTAAAPQCR